MSDNSNSEFKIQNYYISEFVKETTGHRLEGQYLSVALGYVEQAIKQIRSENQALRELVREAMGYVEEPATYYDDAKDWLARAKALVGEE